MHPTTDGEDVKTLAGVQPPASDRDLGDFRATALPRRGGAFARSAGRFGRHAGSQPL